MSDYLDALLDQVNRFSERDGEDLTMWVDDVLQAFQLSRACADARTWLQTATGENAAELRSEVERSHESVLRCLNILGQRAFMLWGVRIQTMTLLRKK